MKGKISRQERKMQDRYQARPKAVKVEDDCDFYDRRILIVDDPVMTASEVIKSMSNLVGGDTFKMSDYQLQILEEYIRAQGEEYIRAQGEKSAMAVSDVNKVNDWKIGVAQVEGVNDLAQRRDAAIREMTAVQATLEGATEQVAKLKDENRALREQAFKDAELIKALQQALSIINEGAKEQVA